MNRNYASDRQKRSGRYPVPRRASLPTARTQDDTPTLPKAMRASLWGLIVFVIAGILSTCIATAVAYANPDPDSLISLASLIAILPPAFLGGLVTSKKAGDSPLLCGVTFALFMTVASLLLSLIFSRGGAESGGFLGSLLLRLPSIGAALLGAFAGGKRRSARYSGH